MEIAASFDAAIFLVLILVYLYWLNKTMTVQLKLIIIALIFSGLFLPLHGQELFSNLTYDEVVQKAKQEQKPYFVDITADWCLPCQLMDETVFQDHLVKQFTAENYLAVQLDAQDFDALILKSSYKVTTLPTILFFDYTGKLIGKEEGLQTGTSFLEILKQYI